MLVAYKGFDPHGKLEGACYGPSRANHFTGSNIDREAGRVKGMDRWAVGTPVSRAFALCAVLSAVLVH